MSEYDVIIVGGGAAGLSAALVLSRARRSVAVVDAGEPRNMPAARMQGFLSRDGMPPGELLATGRAEVAGYGAQTLAATVTTVTPRSRGFDVELSSGAPIRARRLLVTTGLRDALPDIPSVRSRFGRDVLHCPYCHGYEVRDRKLGVIGGSPNSLHQVQLVRQWARDVVFFTNGTTLSPDQREQLVARAIGIVDGQVTGLHIEDDALSGVEVNGSSVVRREAVFVAPGFVANDQVLHGLGAATDDRGWAVVDTTGRTSVSGVWAAGNVTNPRAQVITAAGEGSAAAIAMNADLVEEDIRDALAEFRLGASA